VFTAEERNLLVRLPRWIVAAAIAAHPDSATRARQEANNGFLAVANGRRLGNPVLADIAAEALKVFDEGTASSGVDPATPAGSETILQYAQMAVGFLRAKAEPVDASAYRRWLLAITDDVITDVRAMGGVHIHPEQQSFRQRLADLTRATPPAA
jgi:hypothetical protein